MRTKGGRKECIKEGISNPSFPSAVQNARIRYFFWGVSSAIVCLFASLDVFLVLFGLKFYEQFVRPINLGLKVKASLFLYIVGLKVTLELLCVYGIE